MISADDLLNACHALDTNEVEMIRFDNGLIILQLAGLNQDKINHEVYDSVKSNYEQTKMGLSVHQLSVLNNCSIFLARQRLMNSEKVGLICRDESIQGLAFYPNLFSSSTD